MAHNIHRHACAILRYVGVIWLPFLIRHLYLIGVLLGDNHRTSTIKTHFKRNLDYIFTFYYPLYTQYGTQEGGLMYSIKESTNMHFQQP